MEDEHTKPPFNKPSIIPEQYNWLSLQAKDGADLKNHYWEILVELGGCTGMLEIIFRKAQKRIQDPAKHAADSLRCISQACPHSGEGHPIRTAIFFDVQARS